jgi:hypothetical protein
MRVRCAFFACLLRIRAVDPAQAGVSHSGAVLVTRNPPPWIYDHDAFMLAHVVPVCSIYQFAHVGMQVPLAQWAQPAYEEIGPLKQR